MSVAQIKRDTHRSMDPKTATERPRSLAAGTAGLSSALGTAAHSPEGARPMVSPEPGYGLRSKPQMPVRRRGRYT